MGKNTSLAGPPGARITSPFDFIRKGTPVLSPYSLDDPCCLMDLKRHGYMITENLLLAVIQKTMKRSKSNRDDTRSLEKQSTIQPTRDLKVVEEVPGSSEVAPLCISTDCTRVWARQRQSP